MAPPSVSVQLLSVNTPWVFALGDALSLEHNVEVVRIYDALNFQRLRPRWPRDGLNPHLRRRTLILPPGYASALAPLVRPVVATALRLGRRRLRRLGERPFVLAPYPHLLPYVDTVDEDRLLYFNLDDYVQYRPERCKRILVQEAKLVQRARLSLCLSRYQVDTLRRRHPSHAHRIRHFPLGVTETFIHPAPREVPHTKTVGYVGNLTDRLDWRFVRDVVVASPELRFVFVGTADEWPGEDPPGWWRLREEVRAATNVHFVGAVPQERVRDFYFSFDVNWIPYDVDHPFNRASCPTKIMDGIASARPVLSTDIPECRLYPDYIHVVRDADDAVDSLHQVMAQAALDPDRAEAQATFARQHSWRCRAAQLVALLREDG